MEVNAYIEQMENDRTGKDQFFKENVQSPIPPEEQTAFSGLKYFPVNPVFKFELKLALHATPEKFESADSKGNMRQYYRFGTFQFTVDNQKVMIHAYKSDLSEERLFIPFKDATNGSETYGAGRYLDLEEAHDKTPAGTWVVDFNNAYNPFCAYNHAYACPLTPFENHLKIPIPAGEKSIASTNLAP